MRALIAICALVFHLPGWTQDLPLQLVGEARLQVMFWPVYDSRLYSVDGEFRDGQRPLRLEIHYLRSVAAQDLVESTRTEWQHQSALSAADEQWLQALAGLWPDVGENDVLALTIAEGGESTFLFNGEPLGGIGDPAFGERFVNIWLSPDTSRPELRQDLLGME